MSPCANVRTRSANHAVSRLISVRIGAALWLVPIALPLASLFRNPAISFPAELLALLLAATAFARPAWGVALGAALLPLGVGIGALLHLHFPFTEPLALAVIAGSAARYLIEPRRLLAVDGPMLAWPALLALLVVASAGVQCAAAAAFYPSTGALARQIWDILTFHYFLDVGRFGVLRPAMVMIEGLALLTITVASIDDLRARTLLLRAVLIGGAAVAAHNLLRLSEIALRSGDFWTTIGRELIGGRISAAFADVNTAGSYLVMVLVMAIMAAWQRWSPLGIAITPLVAVGLWISGSRTAQAAGALALAIVIAPRRRRWWVAGAFVLISIGVLWGTQLIRRTTEPSAALFIRVELLKAGAGMLREAPIFGVGIGQFYAVSERFISPELAHYYVRENAHNQFLQVAGELGIAGLVAFLAIVVLVLRRVVRDRARPDDVRTAVAAGLLAFLLSAIGGHPLLVTEVALVFWIVVGLTWASASRPAVDVAPTPERGALGRRAFILAAVVLFVSMPWRIDRALAQLPLEHVGIGVSPWQRDEVGRRYRVMRGHAAIYVPARKQPSRFLARVGDGGPPALRLAMFLDDRLVNEVTLSHAWRRVIIVVPPEGREGYRRVELDVRSADGSPSDARVDIGIVRLEP